jgi:hypothetical protein
MANVMFGGNGSAVLPACEPAAYRQYVGVGQLGARVVLAPHMAALRHLVSIILRHGAEKARRGEMARTAPTRGQGIRL